MEPYYIVPVCALLACFALLCVALLFDGARDLRAYLFFLAMHVLAIALFIAAGHSPDGAPSTALIRFARIPLFSSLVAYLDASYRALSKRRDLLYWAATLAAVCAATVSLLVPAFSAPTLFTIEGSAPIPTDNAAFFILYASLGALIAAFALALFAKEAARRRYRVPLCCYAGSIVISYGALALYAFVFARSFEPVAALARGMPVAHFFAAAATLFFLLRVTNASSSALETRKDRFRYGKSEPAKGAFGVSSLARDYSSLSFSLEESPLSVIVIRRNGVIEYANPTFFAVTGYRREEIIGNPARMLQSTAHKKEFYDAVWKTLKSGKEWRGETMSAKKNGAIFWELASIAPAKNERGELDYYIAIKETINRREKTGTEVAEQARDLAFVNATLLAGNEARSLEQFLRKLLDALLRAFSFEHGAVYLKDVHGNAARLRLLRGPKEYDALAALAFDADKERYAVVYRFGRPITLTRENGDDRFIESIFPMKSKDIVIGSLHFLQRAEDRTSERERALALTVASSAGANVMRLITEETIKEYAGRIEENLREKTASIARAQSLQQHLNTRALPTGETIHSAACYMPSEELGGDFFNAWERPPYIAIVIADCVGHGIESSMDATLLKSISDHYLEYLFNGAPDAFLRRVNRKMIAYLFNDNYPTMFACRINAQTGEIRYANANGELPIVYTPNAFRFLEKADGFHLGYNERTKYELKTTTLQEGETLLFYSDAVTEVNDSLEGENTLFSAFIPYAQQGPAECIDLIVQRLGAYRALPLDDDTTLIALERRAPYETTFSLHAPDDLSRVTRAIEETLRAYHYREEDIAFTHIGAEEMIDNAVTHGNKNDETKTVTAHLRVTCNEAALTVCDEGKGFNPARVPDPTTASIADAFADDEAFERFRRGRGIWLTREYMDSVTYNDKGNCVVITKKKTPPETVFKYRGRSETKAQPFTAAEIRAPNARAYTIDFKRARTVRSKELGTLLSLIRHARREGKTITLRMQTPSLYALFQRMHLDAVARVTLEVSP